MTKILAAAIAVLILIPSAAQARHHHYRHHYRHYQNIQGYDSVPAVAYNQQAIGGRPSGCPHAYCGCAISLKVFGHIIPNLNLASNWYRFPRTSPAPGMVAVRNHHVMQIIALDGNGNATVYDPNGGYHRTWIHTRSLRGYITVNPYGTKIAQK